MNRAPHLAYRLFVELPLASVPRLVRQDDGIYSLLYLLHFLIGRHIIRMEDRAELTVLEVNIGRDEKDNLNSGLSGHEFSYFLLKP